MKERLRKIKQEAEERIKLPFCGGIERYRVTYLGKKVRSPSS